MPPSLTVDLPQMPSPGMGGGAPAGMMLNDLPLRGVTVLAVEDSRFASEALRLMCRRLGARLRRAESLQAAASHLKLYRPDVVIVDLGLPDGRGEALIAEMVARRPRVVVLGMSGDASGRAAAMAAGADGFVDKPVESFAAFHALLKRHLPHHADQMTLAGEAALVPDGLALRDDLAYAAALLDAGDRLDDGTLDADGCAYVAGFVRGVAHLAHDTALAEAAGEVRLDHLRALLRDRLDRPDLAFGAGKADVTG